MKFYHPHCINNNTGGFFQYFRDDGSIYDFDSKHLVSSTRFIFNYSMASIKFDNKDYLDAALHGIDYLRDSHLNKNTGGYAWTMKGAEVNDSTNYCYGLAFVLLAYSSAYKAGILKAKDYIDSVYDYAVLDNDEDID